MAMQDTGPTRQEMTAMRAYRARVWARRLFIIMVVVVLVAIWQDRNMAPPVHDFMHNMAQKGYDYIQSSESLKPHWDKLANFMSSNAGDAQ